MKILISAVTALFLLQAFCGCTDHRETQKQAAFPSTIEGMERLTRQELAALPDVKIQRGVALEPSSLQGKNKVILRLMRNSIFAQYGYPFTIKWIRDYFETRTWYRPAAFDATKVAAIDTANVQTIQKYENRLNPTSPFGRIERMGPEELKNLPDIRATLNVPVDESTLKLMTKRELKIFKNSIFAQYGRRFKTPWLQKYFNSRPWYKRGSFSEALLTKTDRQNVDLVMRYESAGENLPEQQILALGYCERESDEDIERFVFKEGNALEYSVEAQGPYGRSTAESMQAGQWRVSAGGVEYRLAEQDDWEAIQVDAKTHACR
jgi:hypothetical protein